MRSMHFTDDDRTGHTGMNSSGRSQLWGLQKVPLRGIQTMVPLGMRCGPSQVSFVVVRLVPSAKTGSMRMDSCGAKRTSPSKEQK